MTTSSRRRSTSGKKIKALYDDGWHLGTIDYYNVRLQQYHIEFEKGEDDDYIVEKEIDGVDLKLVEERKPRRQDDEDDEDEDDPDDDDDDDEDDEDEDDDDEDD